MSFKKSIIETIKNRKSIRTYDTQPISQEDYRKIQEYLKAEDNLISPSGRKVTFQVVPVSKNMTDKGVKIGTYGFIKNPQGYIVGIVPKETGALLAFGYVFEKLVLYLTELGIGTCWLGGTFTRKSFDQEIDLKENEIIPCITPIGYPKEKKGLMEKAIRYASKADVRSLWERLFYYKDFQTALSQKDAGRLEIPMEMVRLAPSASNKQPWRIVLTEEKDCCHFYLEHTPNYGGNRAGFMMQRIDMGIAICHFELACKELGMEGSWMLEKPEITLPNQNLEYTISWKLK